MPKPEPSGHGRVSSSELIWRAMFLFLFAAVTFGLTFSQAFAAANCSITTVPDPAVIDEGQSVDFTGSVSGKPPVTYSWTFEGGTGDGDLTGETETVSYPDRTLCDPVGACEATLNGQNDKGDQCSASVTVTVNAAGGGNCVRSAPTFTMGDDQTIAPDGSAVYTLSLTNNDTAACADSTFNFAINSETGDTGSFVLPSTLSNNSVIVAPGATDTTVTLTVTGNNAGADGDALTSAVNASDAVDHAGQDQADSVTTTITVGADTPVARGDAYATPVYNPDKGEPGLVVEASRVSGVLYNDFGGTPPLTAQLVSDVTSGTLVLNADGSFSYTPDATLADNDNDSFTYIAVDSLGFESDPATVNINILPDQPDFKIMMNYELGMHCTGFEFAYCCVLPPYNSILAQVVKPQAAGNPDSGDDYPRLLEGSHEVGLDGLNRPTVVQAGELDGGGNYQTYMLEYFHDAQPRREGQGKAQTAGPVPAGYAGHEETLISAVEGNSLFYHSTIYDSAQPDPVTNALVYGSYEGAGDVVQGSGVIGDVSTDNYANGWLNHFYIYVDPAHPTPIGPNLEGHGATGAEGDKIRLGVAGQVAYPADVGAALQPMGPTGSAAGFDNLLAFSGDTGTVVYTQMKVLEDLPVMLTSP
ncbi:MAG: Ig-like domain-containing protein, partial [Gammaproteobacteria bacterium]